MNGAAFLEALAACVGKAHVRCDEREIAPFLADWRGRYRGRALAVVQPASTEEVAAVVRCCHSHGVHVVPQGGNTGLVGGATPLEEQAPAIVLHLGRMRHIRGLEPQDFTVTAEAGVTVQEVQEAARSAGRLFPLSLASEGSATVGGVCATNAGGVHVLRYGTTRDLVLGLEVVLADGTAVRLGGPRLKDVAGLSLTKLFVGSEGTLGVITEVTLRLLPPQHPSCTVVATFPTVTGACDAVTAITAKIRPAMLEFMDAVAINAVEDKLKMGLDRTAAAIMVATSDDRGPAGAEDAEFMATVFAECGATEVFSTSDPDEGEAFVAARRFAIPAVEAKGSLLLEDVGVPLAALADLVAGIEKMAADTGLMISVIAHAGDGNTHPLIVYDPSDAEMTRRAEQVFGDIMDLAISLGGTITGEHGVGRLKKPWLADYLGPEALELNRRIKEALDPDGILNPGAVV